MQIPTSNLQFTSGRSFPHHLKASMNSSISDAPCFSSETKAARASSINEAGPQTTTANEPRRPAIASRTTAYMSGRPCETVLDDISLTFHGPPVMNLCGGQPSKARDCCCGNSHVDRQLACIKCRSQLLVHDGVHVQGRFPTCPREVDRSVRISFKRFVDA